MKTPKIIVLSGAVSPERDVSIVSGKNVAQALKQNFEVESIVLDSNELPSNIDKNQSIVYPALHGDYGEDGTLQAQLDAKGIEYAGCGWLASRVCMIKPAAKALMKFKGLPVAKSFEFDAEQKPDAMSIAKIFTKGAIIKPADKGSSVGLLVAHSQDEVASAIESVKSGSWMVEEFCKGREFSVGVIYGKAAGIVEIIPEGGVYDFKRKYTAGSTRYEFPAKLPESTAQAIKKAAEDAFEACGCRDFSRIDFIVMDDKKPDFIILEINTLPGMTPTSLLPKSASCIGYDFETLCAKLVEGAIKRFNK